MSDERWRCFVAIPIGDRLRADLASSLDAWRERPDLARLRWTDPDGWHLTLAFLGAVPAASVAEVAATVSDVARAHEPMVCSAGGLGAFPSASRARVAWYGVADPDARLASLATDLARALGLDVPERFHPHVTLARARGAPADLRGWLGAAVAPDGEIDIDGVHVMRSHLGRGPARYETLASIPLGVHARV